MQSDQPSMQSAFSPPPVELIAVRTDLTFGDGFRLGCGMMAAFVIFWLGMAIFGLLLVGIALVIAPQLFGTVLR